VSQSAPALPAWLERLYSCDGRLALRRRMVRAGDVSVHVTEVGDGPPVVLLHGNPTWGFLWRRVALALDGAGLRLVMPDLVGLGLSDKPRDAGWHTLERHGATMAAVLDALELGPLTLVAQDWGGPVGLAALADRPERLAGLVLANTVVGPPRPGFKPTPFHHFSTLPVAPDLLFRGLGLMEWLLPLVQGDKRSIRGDVARAYRWPLARMRDRVAPLALARMSPDSLEHPSVPVLRRCQELVTSFRGPVELVWGERDPLLGRVHHHVARLLPSARVTLTRAGHFLQEEVPDELAAAIRRVTTSPSSSAASS
jgi:haloalkane dehalogenase